MEEDPDLKSAIEECRKIVEDKCRKRPYMIIISKANVGYSSEAEKQKGMLRGTATYMYVARPSMGKDAVSRVLLQGAEAAIEKVKKETG